MDIRVASERNTLKNLIWYKISSYVDDMRKDLRTIFFDKSLAPELTKVPPKGSDYYFNAAEKVMQNPGAYPSLFPRGGWVSLSEVRTLIYSLIHPPVIADPAAPGHPRTPDIPWQKITPAQMSTAVNSLKTREALEDAYWKVGYGRMQFRQSHFLDDIDYQRLGQANIKDDEDLYKHLNQHIIANIIFSGFKNNWDFLFKKQYVSPKDLTEEDRKMLTLELEASVKEAYIKTASLVLSMPIAVVYRYLESLDR